MSKEENVKMVEKKAEKAAPVKAEEVKAEAVKKVEVKKPEEKAEVKKPEVKAEVKKAAKPAKKAPAEKKAAAKKAPAAKKTTTRKSAAGRKAAVKSEIHVQYKGKSLSEADLVKMAQDVWQYDMNMKPEDFKSVEIYVKPEENTAYFVVNEKFQGSFKM